MTTVIAHRGYSAKFPENTPLAFQEALNAGANGIELDVHYSADQAIVICHDETVDRTSNGQGLIKELSLDQLKALDFGDANYHGQSNTQIWTLDEFLAWASDYPELVINIEIKNNIFAYESIVEDVATLLDKYERWETVIISSFNHQTIKKMQEINRQARLGFLVADTLLNPEEYCCKYGVTNYHPAYFSVNKEDIQALTVAGVAVNTWTVNKAEDMQALSDLGVTAVITNEVGLAVDVLA